MYSIPNVISTENVYNILKEIEKTKELEIQDNLEFKLFLFYLIYY